MEQNNEKGAIVVEATISFTAFMFAIVIILSIVNICLVQSKMGVVLNGAAKDLSQYSYLYGMTTLNQKQAEVHGKAETASVAIEDTIAQTKSVLDGTATLTTSVDSDADDDELMSSAFNLVIDTLAEKGKSTLVSGVVRQIVKKRIGLGEEKSADEYLTWLGVVGGLEGVHFDDSVFCVGGSGKIILVAEYKVHVLKLLNHEIELRFKQAAATEAWLGYEP